MKQMKALVIDSLGSGFREMSFEMDEAQFKARLLSSQLIQLCTGRFKKRLGYRIPRKLMKQIHTDSRKKIKLLYPLLYKQLNNKNKTDWNHEYLKLLDNESIEK